VLCRLSGVGNHQSTDARLGGGGMDWSFADKKKDSIQNKKAGDHTTQP
jgi:hypothetical protein